MADFNKGGVNYEETLSLSVGSGDRRTKREQQHLEPAEEAAHPSFAFLCCCIGWQLCRSELKGSIIA